MSTTKYEHPGISGIVKPYLCGGSSAMFASACIHPIDLTKVRLQLIGQGSATQIRPSAFSVIRGIVQSEGIRGLYTGLSASLTRQATYGTARIGIYSAFLEKVRNTPSIGGEVGQVNLLWKFLCSFSSGAIASVIGNPFDVALVRMQADGLKPIAERRNYGGVVSAVTTILRQEGLSALYRGYPPTLLRAIAMNVGMMASYDQIKEIVTAKNGEGTSTNLISSAGAGFFCAFFSLPFDMIKTRLQNMKPDASGKLPYTGIPSCASYILKNEGFLRSLIVFYKGL